MSDEATVVGVFGDDRAADVARRLDDDRLDVHVDDATLGARSFDVLVAIEEGGLVEAATADVEAPIVPVAAGPGIHSISIDAMESLKTTLASRDWTVERHRPLDVTVNGEHLATAAFDVTLVTAEAARISEYSIRADGDRVDTVRADGVVIATPAGSHGYARRVGAPVLTSSTGVTVAWIAPFRSDPNQWVLQPSTLSVTVERDDAAVDLLVDDRALRTVGTEDSVVVERGEPFPVAVVAASRQG